MTITLPEDQPRERTWPTLYCGYICFNSSLGKPGCLLTEKTDKIPESVCRDQGQNLQCSWPAKTGLSREAISTLSSRVTSERPEAERQALGPESLASQTANLWLLQARPTLSQDTEGELREKWQGEWYSQEEVRLGRGQQPSWGGREPSVLHGKWYFWSLVPVPSYLCYPRQLPRQLCAQSPSSLVTEDLVFPLGILPSVTWELISPESALGPGLAQPSCRDEAGPFHSH